MKKRESGRKNEGGLRLLALVLRFFLTRFRSSPTIESLKQAKQASTHHPGKVYFTGSKIPFSVLQLVTCDISTFEIIVGRSPSLGDRLRVQLPH